jgi:hypothetical protein
MAGVTMSLKIFILAVVLGTTVAVPSAGATTAPNVINQVYVHLTNSGVMFRNTTGAHTDPWGRTSTVPRGTIAQFIVYNLSKQRRRFNLGGRMTHLLAPHQREIFFIQMGVRGHVPWKSWGKNAKTFVGKITVA